MPPKADTSSWTNEHQVSTTHDTADPQLAVIRHIVSSALAARPALYTQPQMAGVNGNGGDRINKKLQAALGALVKQFPGCEGMVRDEVAKLSARKAPAVATAARSRTGKRKRGEEEEDELCVKEED